MRFLLIFALLVGAGFTGAGLLPTKAAAKDSVPAKQLFGKKRLPADLKARSVGFYSRGCLAGAKAMPVDGPYWQAMRLSRNRNWGHPALIEYLQWLAREAATKDGWPGLLVGDISQPRGGPMLTGHASHQIGLDADVWLTPMPNRRLNRKERESMSAVAVTQTGPNKVYPHIWTDAHFRLIKRAASHKSVQRILVAPGIKKKLCQTETGSKAWLRKIRPYYGDNYHMHIRFYCQRGSKGCKPQNPTPAGDACGKPLDWWYTKAPYADPSKPKKPVKPKPPITLSGLPAACRPILAARDKTETAAIAYGNSAAKPSPFDTLLKGAPPPLPKPRP
jgi:penicillin-insensitive murein endopeptidase